jgi:hypothetical protein
MNENMSFGDLTGQSGNYEDPADRLIEENERLRRELEELRARLSETDTDEDEDEEDYSPTQHRTRQPASSDEDFDPDSVNPEAARFVEKVIEKRQRALIEEQQKRSETMMKIVQEVGPSILGRPMEPEEIEAVETMISILSAEDLSKALSDEVGLRRMIITSKHLAAAQREVADSIPQPTASTDDAQIAGIRTPTRIPKEEQEQWQIAKALAPDLTPEEYMRLKSGERPQPKQ